jgi:recombination protein RecT
MTDAQIVPTKDRFQTALDMIERLKPQMKAALPRHVTPDRMARLVTTTLRRNDTLLQCSSISLAGAIISACQLGLEPDGVLGEYYLTPRRIKGEWQVVGITGYRGLAKLARQSGEVDWLVPHAVYPGDEFHYEYGAAPVLVHRPGPTPRDPRSLTHVYAVAKLRTGGTLFWVLTRAEVDAVRASYAAARDEGPWVTHYEAMAQKTVMRRLCKFLTLSPQLGRAVALEEAAEAGVPQGLEALVDPVGLGTPAGPSPLDALTDALEQANGRTTPTPPPGGPPPSPSAPSAAVPPTSPTPPVPPGPPAPEPPPASPRRPRGRRPRFPRVVERPVRPTVAPPLDAPAPEGGAMTLSGIFDRIEAATTGDALDAAAAELQQLAAVQGWPPQAVQLLREAITLRRRRLDQWAQDHRAAELLDVRRRLEESGPVPTPPTPKPPMEEILTHQIEAVQSVAELDQVVWAAGALTSISPEAKQALRAQIVAKRQTLLAGA